MMENRRIERFVGAWLVLIGAVLCFSGNFYASLGVTQEFIWAEQHKFVLERNEQ